MSQPHFIVVGAGAIGCEIAGWLLNAKSKLTLVGRERQIQQFSEHGLTVRAFNGETYKAEASTFNFVTAIPKASDADAILVCVKSMDTGAVANQIAQSGNGDVPVISCQNGLDNPETLSQHLPDATIIAAMVPFNVIESEDSIYTITTEGQLHIEDHPGARPLVEALENTPIAAKSSKDMQAVQWGKLILNLNNGLNALSGLPLVEQLSDPAWRRVLAACIDEALTIARAEGITPAQIGKVKPAIIPKVLRLPTWLFRILASNMMKIDPSARSSMSDDLTMGRQPEIDFLNGKIVALAKSHNIDVPVNSRVLAAVHELFASPRDNRNRPSPQSILR